MNDEVYFWHVDKQWSLLQVDTIILGVIFFPCKLCKSFLHVDSITLGLCSQACWKYPKQVYNIFVIYQGKCERWTWYFANR